MCIGLPMQVVEPGSGYAVCEGLGERRRVCTLLVGDQPVGAWLLVFLDSAREVLSESDAKRVADAVRALQLVMSGKVDDPRELDRFFPDLSETAAGRRDEAGPAIPPSLDREIT